MIGFWHDSFVSTTAECRFFKKMPYFMCVRHKQSLACFFFIPCRQIAFLPKQPIAMFTSTQQSTLINCYLAKLKTLMIKQKHNIIDICDGKGASCFINVNNNIHYEMYCLFSDFPNHVLY